MTVTIICFKLNKKNSKMFPCALHQDSTQKLANVRIWKWRPESLKLAPDRMSGWANEIRRKQTLRLLDFSTHQPPYIELISAIWRCEMSCYLRVAFPIHPLTHSILTRDISVFLTDASLNMYIRGCFRLNTLRRQWKRFTVEPTRRYFIKRYFSNT